MGEKKVTDDKDLDSNTTLANHIYLQHPGSSEVRKRLIKIDER